MKEVIILMGPPGSGKGTQSVRIAKATGKPHISSGNLFRDHVSKGTPLGRQVSEIIAKGLLVPDELVIAMIEDRISQSDCKEGFIIDGFPRTLHQAEMFTEFLKKVQKLFIVLNIDVSDQEIFNRLTSRITCSSCGQSFKKDSAPSDSQCPSCQGALTVRKDDVAEVIEQRLKTYQEETFPIIEFYRTEGVLVEIDGGRDEEQVFSDIIAAL